MEDSRSMKPEHPLEAKACEGARMLTNISVNNSVQEVPAPEAIPEGRMGRFSSPARRIRLRDLAIEEVSSELVARIRGGALTQNDATSQLGREIQASLTRP